MTKVGFGMDIHAFGGPPPVRLLGVAVDDERGLVGHSDGDAAAHAVIDSVLGAAGLGDIGMKFPSSDPAWEGADSMQMLAAAVADVAAAGVRIEHVDVTIVSQSVRVAPHRDHMLAALVRLLGGGTASVKATTTDHLGAIGRDEGVAAYAIATVSYDA